MPRSLVPFRQSVEALYRMVDPYQEAVTVLNTLQSTPFPRHRVNAGGVTGGTAAVNSGVATDGATSEVAAETATSWIAVRYLDTFSVARRAGINLDDLDKLNVIHVSGSKGKGSTCAYCESILRHHGYKTGFLSSPHLVEVTERFRVNGRPLTKEAYTRYFWQIFKAMEASKAEHDGVMPGYKHFNTIMAYHVFLQEKVDVAIVEVGVGGQYDTTNIIRRPVVCGVTSLGLDHIDLLGDTVEKIAWHKAGIFKPGVPAVTVPQPGQALKVLADRATEIGAPLSLAPSLHQYTWPNEDRTLGIPGNKQGLNASLALQLTAIWLKDHKKDVSERTQYYTDLQAKAKAAGGNIAAVGDTQDQSSESSESPIPRREGYHITEPTQTGLASCKWLGRHQTLRKERLTYYLDGAHTEDSLLSCIDWFTVAAPAEADAIEGQVRKVLLFNCTGERNPEPFLRLLQPCGFDCAVFCHALTANTTDQANFRVSRDAGNARCIASRDIWLRLVDEAEDHPKPSSASERGHLKGKAPNAAKKPRVEDGEEACDANSKTSLECINSSCPAYTFSTLRDALYWATQGRDPDLKIMSEASLPPPLKDAKHIQILVVGSLYLVGGVLGYVMPDINDR